MPDWARRDKYDITATHNPEYQAFSQQVRAMAASDCSRNAFSLQTHRETREMPVLRARQSSAPMVSVHGCAFQVPSARRAAPPIERSAAHASTWD
jgi:hypothetical protein